MKKTSLDGSKTFDLIKTQDLLPSLIVLSNYVSKNAP